MSSDSRVPQDDPARSGDFGQVLGESMQHTRTADDAVDPKNVENLLMGRAFLVLGHFRQHIGFDVLGIDLEQANRRPG